MDFNQRMLPANSGPLPELAPNPMITGITVGVGERSVTGNWLLDTGAAATILSTASARALGLLDEAGQPARKPDFTLALGGIGGGIKEEAGYIVDRLRVPADQERSLEYRRVRVVVRDISVQKSPGHSVTLDGVFGMNLLLPTASGLSKGVPDDVADSPFKRIWIDGRRRTLAVEK
jgi:hypothetical protein